MLIVDDILSSPARGLMFVLREINKAVQAERKDEQRRVMTQLSDLHRQFDEHSIAADAFDAQEKLLLDRLDNMRQEHSDGGAD
jgi:hypothetical protein